MKLKSLTYTSLARLDLSSDDLLQIHATARHRNSLNDITGLLVFNGTHFLQVIEGVDEAIDELVERLRADGRHHHLEVKDVREVEERSFPDWSMEFVRVQSRDFEAREAIEKVLPHAMPGDIRAMIMRKTQGISGTVVIPD